MIHPSAKGREAQIVDYIVSTKRDLKDARKERERKWLDCLEAYLSTFNEAWRAKARTENRSARFLSLSWDAVENLMSQLMAMLFPNEDWYRVKPGRRGGINYADDLAPDAVMRLMSYQHEQMALKREFRKLLKWMIITGNCPWTMEWHTEYSLDYPAYADAMAIWVMEQRQAFEQFQTASADHAIQSRLSGMQGMPPPPVPQMQMPLQPEPPDEIAYEGPRIVVGDPFNFCIDDRANDPLTAFRVTTFWRTKAYLAQMSGRDDTGYAVYENLGDVKDAKQHSEDDNNRNQAVAAAFQMQIPNKDAVMLDQAVGDFEFSIDETVTEERELYRNWIGVVANEHTLVRFEPAHLWSREAHVRLATLIPCPGHTYGIGLLENTLGLQDAINVRTNQIIDATAIAINPETKAIDDGVFDPEHAESGAGAIHLVGNLENLQPIQRNLSGLQLSFSEIGMMKSDFQAISRSANPSMSAQREKSATATAREASISGGSLQEIAKYVEENALVPMLRMQLQYNQQYLDEPTAIRITQDDKMIWKQVSPEDVRRQWDLQVVGSQNQMLRDKRIQDLLQFFQMTSGNPMTAQLVNLPYLMRVVYQEMGFTDADKVFLDSEELALMAQQQMLAMQQEQAGGQDAQPGGGGGAGSGMPSGGMDVPPGIPPGVAAALPFAQQAQNARMDTPTSL